MQAAHQLRTRALGQAGDRSGAILAYEHCRQLLAAEFDVDPSDETRAAYRAAIANDGPAGPKPVEAPPVSNASGGLGTLSVLLAEGEAEAAAERAARASGRDLHGRSLRHRPRGALSSQ